MNYLKTYFTDWTLFEKCWLLIFTLINIYLFFSWGDTLIGLTASLTGMMCVVLVAKGRISNYYFGIINILLYAYIALQAKYYGEVMLNMGYYFPMQFIGLYFWKKNKVQSDIVRVLKLTGSERLQWLLYCTIGVIGYYFVLKSIGGNEPFADSISTVLSVLAMILMVKRITEQWILWIVVDVVSIYMWVTVFLESGDGVSMIVMWTAYLINAIYGYYNWNRMSDDDTFKKNIEKDVSERTIGIWR